MQVSNSITDLLDRGISEEWTQLLLQPGEFPFAVKSNGAKIRVTDHEILNGIEISSELEALEIEFVPGMERSVYYYMYIQEGSGRNYPFKVVSQNFNLMSGGKTQKPIVTFFPWKLPALDLGDF